MLCRTPYTKERYHAEAEYLAGHGYVVAVQDWRQTHGEMDVSQFRSRHEPTDGYDAVEWLAAKLIIDSGLYGSYPARQNGTFGLPLRFRYALQMALQLERDPVRKRMFQEAYDDPTKYFMLLTSPRSYHRRHHHPRPVPRLRGEVSAGGDDR